MPFKSEKQRKWMWANNPEMAKKWEKKEKKMKKETKVKQLIKKMVREIVTEAKRMNYKERDWKKINKIAKKKDVFIQTSYGDQFKWEEGGREGVFATEEDGREIELSHDDIDVLMVEGKNKGLWANIHAKRKRGEKPAKPGDEDYPETLDIEETKKRDYKAEYKKYGSSKKAKKYRAELNKYNRQKGTYGNGDKMDASHKGGKIVGFEEQSKNRGRAEKSRLKKEAHEISFSKEEMAKLHNDGKLEKDGHTYLYSEQKLREMIRNILMGEATTVDLSGMDAVDSGPNMFMGGVGGYMGRNAKTAANIGYSILNNILNDEGNIIGKGELEGHRNPVSFFPAGHAAHKTATNMEDLVGSQAYNKWTNTIKGIATEVGYELMGDYSSDETKKIAQDDSKTIMKQQQEEEPPPSKPKKTNTGAGKVNESGIMYKAGVKKYGKEGMKKIQSAAGKGEGHAEIGKIKDKYDKKKKKNEGKLNERMDRRKAAELLKQLGGNKFIAMTGAKGFAFSDKYASFKIGRNSKGINFVRIGHNAKDLYDMEFGFVSVKGIKVKKKVKDVYADMLGTIFTKYTGMRTSL